MTDPRTILVIHPMAIGDVVLGTPVAAALKRLYPQARVVYFTHTSLFPLLRLCHSIDECLDWTRKEPLLSQLATVKNTKADLIVDLTSSTRTRLLCILSGIRHVRYRKQPKGERPVVHVSTRYMQALANLNIAIANEQNLFPTLFPEPDLLEEVAQTLTNERYDNHKPLLALIPGVGSLRPNRAWPEKHWVKLVERLAESGCANLVLVGGPDDIEMCNRINGATSNAATNFAGKLSLPETAALLKIAALAVSGDTGPCHIAVGVGTPVVSMMGPTLPQRSGPYNNASLGFDACNQCSCTTAKSCIIEGFNGSGACMESMEPEMIFDTVVSALANRPASAGSARTS